MRQLELFDLKEGLLRGERGKTLAADNRATLLRIARGFARQIARARADLTCTADDVQERLVKEGLPLLGNAAGAIFSPTEWEFTGEWRSSPRVTNHGHKNRVWRLKGYVGSAAEPSRPRGAPRRQSGAETGGSDG